MLGFCHALAVEYTLVRRLQNRLGLDPVLTPLLQSLIASQDAQEAGNAMEFLTSQARFVQHQQRMALPFGELPGDLANSVIACWRQTAGEDAESLGVETAMRAQCEPRRTRIELASRLMEQDGRTARTALAVSHGGVSLFLTALALAGSLDRREAVLAASDARAGRLALTLRAAGLGPKEIEEQLVTLHQDCDLPDDFSELTPASARALLERSNA